MRTVFSIDGEFDRPKQAADDGHTPDVARFVKEIDLMDGGDDSPARREFAYRLIAASKNVQSFLEEGARGIQWSTAFINLLARAFNDGHPWVVDWTLRLIKSEMRLMAFLKKAFELAGKDGSFQAQHMRVAEATLSISRSLDSEEPEFLKPMRKQISDAMVGGAMPKEVYSSTIEQTVEEGECPWWGTSWLMSELRKAGAGSAKETPSWLQDAVKREIRALNPHFKIEPSLAAWIEGMLRSDHPPDWIVRLLVARFAETGHVPNFAYGWLQRTINRAVASKTPLPDALVHGIEIHLQTAGDASFADPYVAMALEHGYATAKIEEIYGVMREIFTDHIADPSASPLDKDHPVPEWFPEQERKTLKRQMAEAGRR